MSNASVGRKSVKKASPRTLEGAVVVTRKVHFNAAHRLHNPERSAQWNKKKYGPCNHPNWHGHNYVLEVSVVGEPDPQTGYVIDLSDLKLILIETVVEKCDHRNLNVDVGFLKGIIPSTENLVIAFWRQIEPRISNGHLHRVRLYETENNWADYYGPSVCPE